MNRPIPLMHTPHAGRYKVAYADPAWDFRTYTGRGIGKSAKAHYRTTSLERMAKIPVADVCGPDAWLFMWTTWPHLPQAFELARLWSDPFNPWRYATGAPWVKRPRGWRGDPTKWAMSTGYIVRGGSEPLLIFARGHPRLRGTAERGLWMDPVRRHSEKPESVREMIARRTDGPRLEMFARRRPDKDFDVWGDEAKA